MHGRPDQAMPFWKETILLCDHMMLWHDRILFYASQGCHT